MIKKKELEAVKEQIKSEPELFRMCNWKEEIKCGTAHCIGGWLETLYPNKYKIIPFFPDSPRTSRNFPCNKDDTEEYFDYESSLFHADMWSEFAPDIVREIEDLAKYGWDEYITLDNDSFDDLSHGLKSKFACRIIDEYIKYYGVE